MKPFDNFKSIERFRRHVENDDFMMSHTSEEYGTVTYNNKRYMSAALFYKEYVREYGWKFCNKEAADSPVITTDFLHFCHFYEWHERNDFESYLISQGAEGRYAYLEKYIPIFNENELDIFIEDNSKSQSLVDDTLLLYGWMAENYHWGEASLASLERNVINNLRKKTKYANIISDIRKITNKALGIKPQIVESEQGNTPDIQLDERGKLAVSMVSSGANLYIT